MVIQLSQRFSSMLCLLIYFLHFFISFKYDFHVDAVRMIVKTREMLRNICVDDLKKCMTRCLFRMEELPIFVGNGQLNLYV